MRTVLALPYMLGIDVISLSISMSLLFFYLIFFLKKNRKKWGEDADFLFIYLFFPLDTFSDIAYVFA
jgi:hypothetical protein